MEPPDRLLHRPERNDLSLRLRHRRGCPEVQDLAVEKVDGGAQYVDNTTFYFVTDGQNYHCDIGNLDPNASYRLTISYDSSKYYLYGLLKVEGIG